MPEVKTGLVQGHYQHVEIDAGNGITMKVVDHGVERGICFEMAAMHIGCPSVAVSVQIDWDPDQFFDKLEAVIKAARADLKGIDWEQRRNLKK